MQETYDLNITRLECKLKYLNISKPLNDIDLNITRLECKFFYGSSK